MARLRLLARAQLQSYQRALGVGQVADDFAHRRGQLAHQGRDGDNLVVLGEPRIDQQVDDLDRITAGEVLVAQALQVAQRGERLGRLPGGVEPQLPLVGFLLCFAHLRFPEARLSVCGSLSRRLAASVRCSCRACSRSASCLSMVSASSSAALNSVRRASICASRTARRRASSRCLRAVSSLRASAFVLSRDSWAARIAPVSTPSGPTYTSSRLRPCSVIRNSRIWLECFMPRDLSTYRPRLRSPPSSMSRIRIQVSMIDEMPTSVLSVAVPPVVRLTSIAVVPRAFRKSTSRSSIASESDSVPLEERLLTGSMITTDGLNSFTVLWICARCISRP